MTFTKTAGGFLFETDAYSASFTLGKTPSVAICRERHPIMDLPAVSGLASPDRSENLSGISVRSVRRNGDAVTIVLSARSDLWKGRTFHWTFSEDGIDFEHGAAGACRPGRCYFFSNGVAEGNPANVPAPGALGATIHAHKTFSPAANMADEYERMLGVPQSLGILPEVETPFLYGVPDRTAMIFSPPPLCPMFGHGDRWAGIGLGTKPGSYLFNSLEYSGVSGLGSLFYVNYLGYTSFKRFVSPRMAIRFGYSPFEVLEKHAAWIDANGFGTSRKAGPAPWHRLPVFCGWGQQCVEAAETSRRAGDVCRQANYERWIATLEKRRIPFGTVVIDDKWQATYGTFDIAPDKWPDMRAFVRRQHAAGRHVLLWIPVCHSEGVPAELCVTNEEGKRYADVSNPAYERYLRRKIRHLVRDVGIDGFKVDWSWGVTRKSGLKMHRPLHGIEWLRRFHFIVHDETHRWRPDAMVETHSANPLFRESSDALRLNDLHAGARDIARAMAARARISRIVGWPVIDCDSASGSVNDWWDYMKAQPSIGTPALYTVSKAIPAWMWKSLSALWTDYVGSLPAVRGFGRPSRARAPRPPAARSRN